MPTLKTKTSGMLYGAVAVSMAAILTADLFLTLGIAVWVLYFFPIALSKFAWRPVAPLLTAAGCSTLIVAGYFLSPGQDDPGAAYAPVNRSFAVATFWAAAFIGRQFIVARLAVVRDAWFKAAQAGLSTEAEGELTEPVNFSRPAIDVLFESAADAIGPGLIGVLLTGANDDGARGLLRIQETGGTTVVQSPESALVPTMPEAALRLLRPDYALTLAAIGKLLARLDGLHASRLERL